LLHHATVAGLNQSITGHYDAHHQHCPSSSFFPLISLIAIKEHSIYHSPQMSLRMVVRTYCLFSIWCWV